MEKSVATITLHSPAARKVVMSIALCDASEYKVITATTPRPSACAIVQNHDIYKVFNNQQVAFISIHERVTEIY